jgi:AraC-like DNA-binding protein
MTELSVSRFTETCPHLVGGMGRADRRSSAFGWIREGELTLTSGASRLTLGAGDLFFIPEGSCCRLTWRGTPDIDYYHIAITSKKTDLADGPVFALQRVDALCTEETGRRIDEIHTLFASGLRTDKLRALGLYYILYADILPHLAAAPPPRHSPAVADALAYIERRIAEDYSMDELAAASAVSTSRLFHLFRSELGTTPVRFRNHLRVERAAVDLRTADDSVDDIAARYGFHSAAYFRETFKACVGMTPSEYRAAAVSGQESDENH